MVSKNGICLNCKSNLVTERKVGQSRSTTQSVLFLVAIAAAAASFLMGTEIGYYVGGVAVIGVFVVPGQQKTIRKCANCGHEWVF